jgi:hypothetical protein
VDGDEVVAGGCVVDLVVDVDVDDADGMVVDGVDEVIVGSGNSTFMQSFKRWQIISFK